MKRIKSILLFVLIGLILAALPQPAFATCSLDKGNRQYSATYTLTDSGSAQCKPPNNKPNGTYTVWCDLDTEAFAADSVRVPLCGSSQERGKANATCYQCGGTTKCDGVDFGLGTTDKWLTDPDNRKKVDPADSDDQKKRVWRITPPADTKTFTYNGHPYNYSGGDIILCAANNMACGSSEQCTNIIYPDVTNHGTSGDTVQCSAQQNADLGNFSQATAACTGQQIDVLPYVAPCKSGSCPQVAGSVFTKEGAQIGNIVNQIQWLPDGSGFKQVTNLGSKKPREIFYKIEGGVIRRIYDTTLADESKYNCPSDPTKPVYQKPYVQGSGAEGIGIYDTTMTCGVPKKLDNVALRAFIFDEQTQQRTETICNNHPLAGQPQTIGSQIIFQGTVQCNTKPVDVIAIQNTTGPGTGEVYFYCKGQGLCSFYQGIDFSQTLRQPQYWNANTDICSGTFSDAVSACAVPTVPQETSVAELPGLADFAQGCRVAGSITCLATEIILKYIGAVFPYKNQIKKPSVVTEATQLKGAADPLTPLSLQKAKKPITNLLPVYVTGNLGSESEGGTKCYDVDRGTITSTIAELNTFTGEAAAYNRLYGPLSDRKDLNLARDFPDQKLPDRATRGCTQQSQGIVDEKPAIGASAGQHEYNIDGPAAPVIKAVTKLGASIVSSILSLLASFGSCKAPDCVADASVSVQTFWHTLVPWGAVTSSNIGANSAGTRTGFVAANLPASVPVVVAPAIEQNQLVDHPGIGANNDKPAHMDLAWGFLGGAKKAIKAFNCAITPASLQKEDCTIETNLPNIPNTSDWAQSGAITPISATFQNTGDIAGALTSTAAQVGIPSCVLEGVAEIEGAYKWTKNDPRIAACTPNVCGAAGPFQITTGKDKSGSTSCSQCIDPNSKQVPDWIKQHGCPDVWPDREGSPCDFTASARVAAQKLKNDGPLTNANPTTQKDAILNAAYRYYGGTYAIPRLGGCTYGEFVYKHCDPSYSCNLGRGR